MTTAAYALVARQPVSTSMVPINAGFLIKPAWEGWCLPNALVQLQAQYNNRDEVASEKCLSAATFVRWCRVTPLAPVSLR